MTDAQGLENDVRRYRERAGWSQSELAHRSGISRAGISAIETGGLVPSTAAALALARAFECTVEDLFRLPRGGKGTGEVGSPWAWHPARDECRYWRAELSGRVRTYPVEVSPLGLLPHDGTFQNGIFRDQARVDPEQSLVIACCDPAVGLLAGELARMAEVRLIVLQRSSHAALQLLDQGLIHAAGVHLARADEAEGNATAVQRLLGEGREHRLLRVADWDEGIALAPRLRLSSVQSVVNARIHWVAREAGSGAQQCLDEVIGPGPTVRPGRIARLAFDHRGVADVIRGGWADAGICLRLTSLEANLDFLDVRREAYDLCFPSALAGDARLQALVRVVRSKDYRRLVGDLPGYDSQRTGDMHRIGRKETAKKPSSSK